jgi:peptidoglycan hydrolase-like protein with peptidoglycan-binding domain
MVLALILVPLATPARGAAPAAGAPALSPGLGMRHEPSLRVRALQRALIADGYRVGPTGADGRFGPRTVAAVRRLQADHGLRADGVVGRRTRQALRSAAPALAARSAPAATAQPIVRAAAPAEGRLQLRVVDRSHWAEALLVALSILIAAVVAVVLSRQRRVEASRVAAYLAPSPPASGFVGYVPVPAERNGHDPDAAARVIERFCERAGLRLTDVVVEPATGGVLERAQLAAVRRRIADGRTQGLIVSDARRLGTARDLAAFLRWALTSETTVIAADLGLDTSTPEGRRMASALITFSGWGLWSGQVAAPPPASGTSALAPATAEPGPRT